MRRIPFDSCGVFASILVITCAQCALVACSQDATDVSSSTHEVGDAAASGTHDAASSPPATGLTDGGAPAIDAGTDASSADDSSTSAPLACGDLPICDDFESSAAGAPPSAPKWSVVTPSCSGTGVVAVDGTVAHSGARSVKVTGAGGYCNHVFFASTTSLSTIGPHVFGRFYVRMATPLDDGHVTFMAMRDATDGKDLRMGGQNKVLMWNRESDDATLPAMSPAGTAMSASLPIDEWRCVEIEVDGTAGTIHTWLDGAVVGGLVEDGVATPDVDAQWLSRAGWKPSLTDIRFGWESYGGQAETLWFDDVAIGTSRIGCSP